MRGKRAKALRRLALAQVGSLPRSYRQSGTVHPLIGNGMPITLDPFCTRAVYQRLKRAAQPVKGRR